MKINIEIVELVKIVKVLALPITVALISKNIKDIAVKYFDTRVKNEGAVTSAKNNESNNEDIGKDATELSTDVYTTLLVRKLN